MFTRFDQLIYDNKPLPEYHFYIMGQICIAKEYRGKGLFDMLYEKHKEIFQSKYDFVITEVATRNIRSMRAHIRVGFKIIATYTDELDEWAVVIWDWRK
jgi:ribosomal protein S18 acetylase RimI-like enzyme